MVGALGYLTDEQNWHPKGSSEAMIRKYRSSAFKWTFALHIVI